MAEDIRNRCKNRLVELNRVDVVEIGDRVCPEIRPEEIRVRIISAGERVAVPSDQHIGAIAAEEGAASSKAVKNVWPVATGQCRIDALLIAYTRIEYHHIQISAIEAAVAIGHRVLEHVLRNEFAGQRTVVCNIGVAAVTVERQ